MKRRGDKIVMITAYDAPSGRIADAAGVDLILVGDSAAMVVLGHDSTVPVTMDEMIVLTRAVNRGGAAATRRRRPAVRLVPGVGRAGARERDPVRQGGGADAVKLEGAGPMLSRVRAIADAGIPVMGHIGLTPQTATMLGGFKAQGRTAAKAVSSTTTRSPSQEAGCFAIVLEAVPSPVAEAITDALEIPTIGIGAGATCDGQVLVWHDLLGLYDGHAPRFVKQYAELAPIMQAAVADYASEVRNGAFPEQQHTYSIPEDELALFEEALAEVRAAR